MCVFREPRAMWGTFQGAGTTHGPAPGDLSNTAAAGVPSVLCGPGVRWVGRWWTCTAHLHAVCELVGDWSAVSALWREREYVK